MEHLLEYYKYFLKGILLSVFIIWSYNSVLAQSAFNRNDNYDFRGLHHLSAGGSNPDNFNIFIESDSDFRKFKLHIKMSRLHLNISWLAINYRVDMNNDGTWELGWTSSDEATVSYNYPDPPNGINANYTIKVEIEYYNYATGSVFRTKYKQISVLSTPRVFVDSDNNSFIQLRNEDPTFKIPVLMVEGFDPLNEKYQDTYYNLTWELVNTDLYPNNYEVFILNFNNGGRDLRLNAQVLLKAIEKVHEVCPNYKIALSGLSMGGPIGRYALAKKEAEGGIHHVGMFLSYDSPQWWAHVSPDLQDWIKIQSPNEGAIAELQANLQSVGAKQMLYYNTYDPNHTYRLAFYNELNGYNGDGYPHQSYNVSVSNGNFNATYGYGSVGRHLMTMKINDNLIKDVPAVQLDCGAGSMITDITAKRYGDIFNNPLIHVWYELEIIFNPSYTPTYSSLDLVNPSINPITGDITSFERSKFDSYVVQTTPLQHHELSTLTRSTIMDWLDLDFNIGINYDFLEGGSTSPNNYQINILHGIPITVQPKTVTVNGKQVTYNFANWWDGNTSNPRTFYTSHDVTHTATMKGHLISNTSIATSGNNQRKLAVSGSTKHLVYTSMDDIWYSRNTGSRWSNEMRVEGDAKNPSVHSIGSFVYIVWETDMGDGERRISFRKSTNNGVTWGEITEWTVYTDDFDATPVVAGGSQIYNRIVVVWRQSNGLYICKPEVSTTGALIPNTTYQSELPSLAEDYNGYSLAYKNGSTIYHRGFTINPAGTITYEGSSPVTISTSGCTNPSVSRMWVSQSVSNIAVAYERVVSGYSRIGFKNKNASGWQSAVEIIEDPNQLTQPSVCYDQASGKIHLFLNYNSSVAHSMRDINSGSWEPISVLGSGNAPQLPSYSNSGPVTALWTSGSNAPYSINISEIQSVSGPISSNTTWSGYVNVTGNVTVNAGATLEILPGTAIAFASGTSLIVNGILDATGTSDERITFTSPHWVKVQNGNSIFKYCTFENAYYGLYLDGVSSGNPTIIEHCIFRDNATGLRFRNSNLAKVKSCQMYDNSYSGVFCDNSDVDFTGNQIYNNVLSGVGSTSGSLLQYYGNVIENNGRRGIYAASGDVVYIGKVYGWWGYNTIRYNNWDEVYAYSGNPHVEISGASIHDEPETAPPYYVEVYNYPGNQAINAQSVWWDANCAQTSGNVYLMAYINCFLPTTPPDNWEGQPVTSGSPIGKAVANPLAGEIEWFLDPDIPDEDKIRIGKDIIAANPKSVKGKEALFWIYSIIRSDYREDNLREKSRFFDYLYNIQSKYAKSEIGKLALQYMIIWKMLERDYSSVIEFCNEALEQFTGEERKSVLTDLVFTYIHSGQIGEAKVALQELRTRYSVDQETIALIEWDIDDVEEQIANGYFKPKKSLVSEASLPKEFELFSNYPNPFNPSTTIMYALPYQSSVYLSIYDITGRLIKSFSIPSQSSGYQSIVWNGTNENGNAVSSGVYLYRISVKSLENNETYIKTAKLMMLK